MAKEKKKAQAYIVSRAAQDIEYTAWEKSKTGAHQKVKSVVVKGGAYVINRETLKTPKGVITPVTDEELKFLESNSTFKIHQERGFIEVIKSKDDAEDVADEEREDSEGHILRDNGSQLTKKDFKDRGLTPPKVKGDTEKDE